MMLKKAIFLDRDGTINEDEGYVYEVEKFKLLPRVIEGLKLLQEDYLFFIITNQSGIARGYYTYNQYLKFNDLVINARRENNIIIKETYCCPHITEDNCDCKKPTTFFIDKAVNEYNIDVKGSWMIGDHPSDIQLGLNAGCKTVYVCTGHGPRHYEELKEKNITPTIIATNFLSAVQLIKKFIE